MQIDDEERRSRTATVNNAIASQNLEGLEVPVETIEDLRKYAAGEMMLDEVKRRALDRIEASRLATKGLSTKRQQHSGK